MGKFIFDVLGAAALLGVICVSYNFGKFTATKMFLEVAEENGGTATIEARDKRVTITIEAL